MVDDFFGESFFYFSGVIDIVLVNRSDFKLPNVPKCSSKSFSILPSLSSGVWSFNF